MEAEVTYSISYIIMYLKELSVDRAGSSLGVFNIGTLPPSISVRLFCYSTSAQLNYSPSILTASSQSQLSTVTN
jgi:hypothetical protein